MKRAEIIRLAVEADLYSSFVSFTALERFAALVSAAERKACAEICDERAAWWPMGSDERGEAEDCAYAIRTRRQE